MDFNFIQIVIAITAAVGGAIGFMEMRINRMYTTLQEKIEDKNQINRVVQESLKEDIARLEAKIDMLLQMSIKETNHR